MKGLTGFLAAVTAVLLLGTSVVPASAEFFGCNDKTKVSSYSGTSRSVRAGSRYTHEFAAQSTRPRITIESRRRAGPGSVRQCRSTLVKEYRPSGTVIVPRMQCWWE